MNTQDNRVIHTDDEACLQPFSLLVDNFGYQHPVPVADFDSSTAYTLKVRIKAFNFYSSIIRFKLPVNLGLSVISICIPFSHFISHLLHTINSTGKALPL